jgi:hypothetical protein
MEFVALLSIPAELKQFLAEVKTYVWSGPLPREGGMNQALSGGLV